MKRIILILCLSFAFSSLFAQSYYEEEAYKEKFSFTVGILQGGGSLVGGDLEYMLSDHIGAQVGAGFMGYGAGFNVHLKPDIRSSFFSLTYWHQGIGATHTQTAIGPTFVYRAPKWFTAQLGLGYASKGPAWPAEAEHSSLILMYSIGAYFPW